MKGEILDGIGNIVGSGNTINISIGEEKKKEVVINMALEEFRGIIHDAEMYRKFGADIKNKAKRWDSLHPSIQSVLEEYRNCPLQIIPMQ